MNAVRYWRGCLALGCLLAPGSGFAQTGKPASDAPPPPGTVTKEHDEGEGVMPPAPARPPVFSPAFSLVTDDVVLLRQVNVNGQGLNIAGDAANEPSIVIDPNAPNRISIGWRQFDSVSSNFRRGGRAYQRRALRAYSRRGDAADVGCRLSQVRDYLRSAPLFGTGKPSIPHSCEAARM